MCSSDLVDEIKGILETYKAPDVVEDLIKELEQYKGQETVKYNQGHAYFETYRDLEHIHENDPLGLNKGFDAFWHNEEEKTTYIKAHKTFNQYYKDKMYQFKNIMVYFIFRYFMKAIFDYDVSAKIKLAIMSMLMIKELAVLRWLEKGTFTEEDMVDISHMYSKDVEHLEENIETLQDIFETEEAYEVDRLILTLMNAF